MADNFLSNGDFETGLFLPEWVVSFGTPSIITNADSPFGGTKACNVDDALTVMANNTGAAPAIGVQMHGAVHVELVSGVGAILILFGASAPYQGGLIVVYSDGVVEYHDGDDSAVIHRKETIEDPTKRFVLTTAWTTTRIEGSIDIGIAVPPNVISQNIRPGFGAGASWLVDDAWVSTTAQENRLPKPPNGPGPSIFQASYFDEIHGTLHKRKDIHLDYDLRFRNIDDEIRLDHDDYEWNPGVRRFSEP